MYKANDTRLERTVAVKILPEHLAASPERKARFEREAKAISQLNHPHICTLYDVGEQDGLDYLVMEYIEGETLAERLKRGPLPLDEALEYGIQIADGLVAAHRAGIVHRDLKPGNAMLTKFGIKLLDFGLAKLLAEEIGPATSDAPTRQKDITKEHAIIGTLQYMAPEQLEGKSADARTDIFALGSVLYEMLTGCRAYEGDTQASLISAIMSSEPVPVTALVPLTPAALERLVQRCLAKAPDDRWQTAADLGRVLSWIAEGGFSGDVAPSQRRSGERIVWGAVVVSLLAALSFLALDLSQPPAADAVQRLSMAIPDEVENVSLYARPSISPDGRHVVFHARERSGMKRLWVRSLDSPEGRPLPGTEGASFNSFWSPDSQFVAFFVQDELKKIPLAGGPVQTICNTGPLSAPDWGEGAWSPDGVILFMPREQDVLFRVPASGGVAEPATSFETSRGERGHFYPQFLPDGRRFLYLARGTQENSNGIYLGSLDSDQTELVLSGGLNAVYSRSGHLLAAREGTLLAYAFDAERGRLTADPVPIATGVPMYADLRGQFTVSDSGLLAYSNQPTPMELAWLDRKGKRVRTVGESGTYLDIELSPDGRRLAIERFDPNPGSADIWQLDLARDVYSRLTFDPTWAFLPRWSRDGELLVFVTWNWSGGFSLYQVSRKDTREPELLFDLEANYTPYIDWSHDGRYVAVNRADDVLILPLFGDREPHTFLDSHFKESYGRFSPDGHFFAYVSNETGRDEVYVTTFPEPGSKWIVSTEGGRDPKWRPDGEELFFVSASGLLMAVNVNLSSGFDADVPKELFPVGLTDFPDKSNYAVTADGEQFLVLGRVAGARPRPFTVVLNWQAELPF